VETIDTFEHVGITKAVNVLCVPLSFSIKDLFVGECVEDLFHCSRAWKCKTL